MKYYYIYKITNKINNKIYYGQHTTSNLDDGYMGSGVAMLKALKKYGKENFEKKILKFYNSPEELNIVEARLVNERWLEKNKHRCYNLQTGGDHRILSDESKKKISESKKGQEPWNKGKNVGNSWNGKHHSEESKHKMSDTKKGKKHTSEHKKKISESCKGRNAWNKGITCSKEVKEKLSKVTKGTYWYNNGQINVRARECPDGFVRGRLKK